MVILGAGASYDCANEGVSILDAGARPPLAAELFSASRFQASLDLYEGARALAPRLASVAGVNLEQRLAHYARGSASQRARYLHVPPYIRDVVAQCTNHYATDPGCHISLVLSLMEENVNEVLFITLNYDTYIEKALFVFDRMNYRFNDVSPSGGDSYVRQGRAANLVKVHGSVDWVRPLPDPPSGGWFEALAYFDPQQPWQDIRRAELGDVISQARVSDRWVYPVITAPLAEKRSTDLICPPSHLEFAWRFLPTAQKFLFIGTSGTDDDLFRLMDQHMPHEADAWIVGGDPEATLRTKQALFERLPSLSRYELLQKERVKTFPGGFRAFVASDALDAFGRL